MFPSKSHRIALLPDKLWQLIMMKQCSYLVMHIRLYNTVYKWCTLYNCESLEQEYMVIVESTVDENDIMS